jgi:hypothetical protein
MCVMADGDERVGVGLDSSKMVRESHQVMTEPETQSTTTDAQQNQFGYRTLESTHYKVRGEIIDG